MPRIQAKLIYSIIKNVQDIFTHRISTCNFKVPVTSHSQLLADNMLIPT